MDEDMKSSVIDLVQSKKNEHENHELFRMAMREGLQQEFGGKWACDECRDEDDAKGKPHLYGSLLCFCTSEDKNDMHSVYQPNENHGRMITVNSNVSKDDEVKIIKNLEKNVSRYPNNDKLFKENSNDDINSLLSGDWIVSTTSDRMRSAPETFIDLYKNGDKATPISVWRIDSDNVVSSEPGYNSGDPLCYDTDMPDKMKRFTLSTVRSCHKSSYMQEEFRTEFCNTMDKHYGPEWKCRSIDSEKKLPIISYLPGTLMTCSPDGRGKSKVLIWKQSDSSYNKKSGCCYCC